jgi:CubicO group peptidase (beta-lactamase class C family)
MLRTLCSAFALTLALGVTGPARAVPIYDFAPVAAEMQTFVQSRSLDGASLRVNKAGNVVYRRSFGGYTLGTRIRIASASKWLSALTIARVVEKGQLRWTDTVGQYFPDVEPAKRAITLEQMFSHTSGMQPGEDTCMSNPLFTLATCANRILQQPLIGEPGKVFAYGGGSMQVAGRMAELATGKAWDDIFIDEVVTPLGLDATDFATSSTAAGYVRNTNPRIGGGVRSTLEDYGRVVDMVLAYGCLDNTLLLACLPGRRFLARSTIDLMARDRTVGTVDVSRPDNGIGFGYGLGQWIDPSSPLIVSSPGAFGFTPWVDRNSRIAGVFMVEDLNARVADDITDIRLMINVVTAEGQGRRIAMPQPARPPMAPAATRQMPAKPTSPPHALTLALRQAICRREARLQAPVDLDPFDEHRVRSHPQRALAVQRAIQHIRIQRLAVPHHIDDLVFAALVVPVAACRKRGQWRKCGHGGLVLGVSCATCGAGRRIRPVSPRPCAPASARYGSTCGEQNKHPQPERRQKVDGEHQAAKPDVRGRDLDQAVGDAPADERPCQNGSGESVRTAVDEQQARRVEKQRPLELIRQVRADAGLDGRPWVGAVRTPADAPDFRCACDGEQRIEQRRKRDMGGHGKDQCVRHRTPGVRMARFSDLSHGFWRIRGGDGRYEAGRYEAGRDGALNISSRRSIPLLQARRMPCCSSRMDRSSKPSVFLKRACRRLCRSAAPAFSIASRS